MLTPIFSTQFKKDYKLCQKRKFSMLLLFEVMKSLENERPLQPKHRNHQLKGDYKGYSECHIAPDWLLIYDIDLSKKEVYFARTGTHSDLF